jgi:hypothetical protein
MAPSRAGRAAALSLVLGSTACATVHGSFQRSPRVSGPAFLQVETGSGDVTVVTGPPGQVSIIGRITASSGWFGGASEEDVRAIEKSPPLRQEGSSIHLDRVSVDNVSIDYEITVPPDTRVRADTGSGNHRVRGVRGGVAVVSGSGDIRLDDVGGGVAAETGSGDVRGNGLAGGLDARTGSGDIEVGMSGPGDVRATTGSGDADIRGVDGALVVDTGSGGVEVEGNPRAAWKIGTSSGDVRLRLPAGIGFDVDLSTSSGDIDLGRPVQTVMQGRVSQGEDHVTGRVGAGGPMVHVSTGSGDVTID